MICDCLDAETVVAIMLLVIAIGGVILVWLVEKKGR